jgi:hypothetical protein
MTVKRSDLAILRQIGKTLKFVSTNGLQWVLVSWSLLLLTISGSALAQDENELAYNPNLSIARNWNEALLFAIRNDFARPTVHARNLFHASAAMYDSWSLYSNSPSLYFLGRTLAPDNTALSACELSDDLRLSLQDSDEAELLAARETTLSYSQYRLLNARFAQSPGVEVSLQRFDALFTELGFDSAITSTDVSTSTDPARLGNYLASCVLAYGQADGANEINDYANRFYTPSNSPLNPTVPGNANLTDPNRWQSLELDTFIDQSGNPTQVPIFLGAEWNQVEPFALTDNDVTQVRKDGRNFSVYLDPGPPALLGDDPLLNLDYQQGHALVALWSSHLDPTDGVSWDISPASLGNITSLPSENASLLQFYNELEGGTDERGYASNPISGMPYEEQLVPRGDFTRVLAEFWADGPESETPPGHWFQIYNSLVSDHPDFTRSLNGDDEIIGPLEYDIRTYFTLGAAMHDSAIAAWSVKGAYDYIRPISALRYMASLGQSTDLSASNYHIQGIPLQPGYIESILSGDPLAGNGGVNIGRIKARVWRGPGFIRNPETDVAGVGWILLENWWPYQRPSFVTPPFAGYVSGHSTFSRAAADVLTALTGSPYFPGGLAEYTATKDEFLVFEEGPSVDVTLQWASYRDASDQTSLSRIWGGIHPPVDDIPGRRIGSQVAERVLARTKLYYDGEVVHEQSPSDLVVSDNRGSGGCTISGISGRRGDELLWLFFLASFWMLNRGRMRSLV